MVAVFPQDTVKLTEHYGISVPVSSSRVIYREACREDLHQRRNSDTEYTGKIKEWMYLIAEAENGCKIPIL